MPIILDPMRDNVRIAVDGPHDLTQELSDLRVMHVGMYRHTGGCAPRQRREMTWSIGEFAWAMALNGPSATLLSALRPLRQFAIELRSPLPRMNALDPFSARIPGLNRRRVNIAQVAMILGATREFASRVINGLYLQGNIDTDSQILVEAILSLGCTPKP